MKLRILSIVMGASLAFAASAQTVHFNPLTGDAWVDTNLGVYDDYWRDDRARYLDTMYDTFGYDRQWYEEVILRGDVSASELYYACSLARQLGRTCQSVLDDRQEFAGQGQGWGAMAKRYGIKPGSAEFHRMKSSMQQDYSRLDRDNARVIDTWRQDDPGRTHHAPKSHASKAHEQDLRTDKGKKMGHPGKGDKKNKKKSSHKKSHDKGPGGR